MNSTILLLIAKFWDKFKQNNPVVAFAIYIACAGIVIASAVAPDYGLGLPKWFSILVTAAAAIYGGANGSRTSQILNQNNQNQNP